ncbi:hypothetical protein Salat_0286500 [Sesamum alatum]|uniref:Uncharacterized protein n=1 Tax=Sesamum alatum TaxID=300844 RepID=A0AAE1Z186_9LAMI|nr:hypothetical protein Salat_0286500 [Sesamum alatum]
MVVKCSGLVDCGIGAPVVQSVKKILLLGFFSCYSLSRKYTVKWGRNECMKKEGMTNQWLTAGGGGQRRQTAVKGGRRRSTTRRRSNRGVAAADFCSCGGRTSISGGLAAEFRPRGLVLVSGRRVVRERAGGRWRGGAAVVVVNGGQLCGLPPPFVFVS